MSGLPICVIQEVNQMIIVLPSGHRPYLKFTLSLTLFLYPFRSTKCRLDIVQELCVEHLFVLPIFLYIFSVTASQKLSGITACVTEVYRPRRACSATTGLNSQRTNSFGEKTYRTDRNGNGS